MQLIRHIKDEDLTDLLLQDDEADLHQLFGNAPTALQVLAEKPEWFWQKQRACLRRRIASAKPRLLHPMNAWAGALALFLLAFSLFNSRTTSKPVASRADSDQQLLIAVEQAVETDGPASLEPAALLADEISNSPTAGSSSRNPRRGHHEN